MKDLLQLRCSALPLAFLCPASVREPEQKVRVTIDGADTGSAAHELLRKLPTTGSANWKALPDVARRWGVDEAELRVLCALGTRLWEQVCDSFPNAVTETETYETEFRGLGFVLTGHMDILSVQGYVGRVGDWKTGRVDTSPKRQMQGYALLVSRNVMVTEVSATAIWVRDETVENYRWTTGQLDAFARRINGRIVEWDGTFYPGDHCGLCPRRHECSAVNAHNKAAVSTFVVDADRMVDRGLGQLLAEFTDEQKYKLYRQAKLAADLANKVREALRDDVLAHGPIEHGGKRLAIIDEPRKVIDPVKALPVLQEHGFDDEMLRACLRVGRSDMNKATAQRAGYGNGAAAVRALTEDLENAGAISETTVQKLTERRA